ncbi:hypothetical protein K3495_g495 [Podosphaera aphanis]|nr:hypothetical protein K3495_g495 [Podosphaera aphanis]
MTPEIRKFVDDRVLTQTPQEIYHHLLSSGLATADEIAEHQVYYQWRQANKSHWRRDEDPVLSAGMLLEENRDTYHHRSIFVANFRALSFYIRASIDALLGTTRDIAIDATYGTNNAGMELYTVLARLDGAGASMVYLFVEKNNSFGTSSPGTMTQVIYQFLKVLDNLGVNPSFVDCDKDKSEINAIEVVWLSARIQLCFWHAKRAVEMKLKNSNANSLLQYSPGDAQVIVPSLEICWGSIPVKRPDSNHMFGFCQCKSKKIVFEGNGLQEHSSPEDQKTVLEMFSRHFNAHPLIPDRNGILRTARTIHSECASEIYNWCYAKGFYKLWAYLFANWYDFSQWKL